MKEFYLLLENDNYFANHIEFGKIEIEKIITYFKKKNINLKIIKIGSNDIPKNSIIFTTSSQKPYQKQYIDDYLELLESNNNILIPSRKMIKAHDNKGYQEFYKSELGITSLKSLYVNKDNINYSDIDNEIGYPLVLKKLEGSGSKGVQLIKNKILLIKEIEKLQPSLHIRYIIYLKEKFKNFFLGKNNNIKVEYFKDYGNYVVQEFVANLQFDYKVLIFFDKYYVLKRNIKKNDFRASGSGNFEFIAIEDSLLEYSKNIFEKFNEPFISLDVCFDGDKYFLIEYQGIHFGPYTQIYAEGFYKKINDQWKFIKKKVSLEEDIAYSLYSYLETNHLV